MAKDPAFLFYFRDFLVSTSLMTPGEVGSYIRILCQMADKGPLTMFQLKQIAEDGTLTDELVSKLNVVGNDRYYQKRLDEEVKKRQKFSKGRRENLGKSDQHMSPHMGNANANNKELQNNDVEIKFLEFVLMTQSQYDRLAQKIGSTGVDKYIEKLNNYIGSKGKKYKSHYHTILTWHSRDGGEKPSEVKPVNPADPNCRDCGGSGVVFAQGSSKNVTCWCRKEK